MYSILNLLTEIFYVIMLVFNNQDLAILQKKSFIDFPILVFSGFPAVSVTSLLIPIQDKKLSVGT